MTNVICRLNRDTSCLALFTSTRLVAKRSNTQLWSLRVPLAHPGTMRPYNDHAVLSSPLSELMKYYCVIKMLRGWDWTSYVLQYPGDILLSPIHIHEKEKKFNNGKDLKVIDKNWSGSFANVISALKSRDTIASYIFSFLHGWIKDFESMREGVNDTRIFIVVGRMARSPLAMNFTKHT